MKLTLLLGICLTASVSSLFAQDIDDLQSLQATLAKLEENLAILRGEPAGAASAPAAVHAVPETKMMREFSERFRSFQTAGPATSSLRPPGGLTVGALRSPSLALASGRLR